MSDCRRHRHSYLCLLPVILSEDGENNRRPSRRS